LLVLVDPAKDLQTNTNKDSMADLGMAQTMKARDVWRRVNAHIHREPAWLESATACCAHNIQHCPVSDKGALDPSLFLLVRNRDNIFELQRRSRS
jgi:hypothetical protein